MRLPASIQGKVSCLMATYGRYRRVCEALACFLHQDYPHRELVILNNHPESLLFDHPQVTIINEPGHPTLGHCRNRLLDWADGEFVRTWDDDDIYMPWCISQGVRNIGEAMAWKPARSWWCDGNGMGSGVQRKPGTMELAANAMEASVTWRTDFVRSVGYHYGEGDEHKTLTQALGNKGPASLEMHEWAGYCYRFGVGEWHCSGSLGNNLTAEANAIDWQAKNGDVRPGVALEPATQVVKNFMRHICKLVHPTLQTSWMKAAYRVAKDESPPLPDMSKDKTGRCSDTGRTVAAPGCWDLFHDGHLELLRWARRQGDWLVVLVNNDAGVSIQKGIDRPLVPLEGRVASLAALDCVDSIVVVEGRDDMPALHQIRPKVLVKGPDYTNRAEFVPHPEGCEVRIAPLGIFQGHTSGMIK